MAARGVTGPGIADDGSLQAAAIGGDGHAFAELYDRHEQRVYGFCLRVLGSPHDAADATQETFLRMLVRLPALEGRELNFVAYVLTTARHACYDMIASRRTVEPVAEAPEPAIATPGPVEEDPERATLLAATREQVEVAVAALPARQREVLALREVECLSYDEIAEIIEIKANAVAQLISRARIKLRDLMRGGALASIDATSPDCDRALPLIAMQQDGEQSSELDWLRSHLSACPTCRTRQAAMQETGVSYRLLIPAVPAIWLRHASIARAAEELGVDWSEVASAGAGAGTGTGGGGAVADAAAGAQHPDAIAAHDAGPATDAAPRPLIRAITGRGGGAALAIAAFLAVLLLLTGSLSDRLLAGSSPASFTAPSPSNQFAAPAQSRGQPPRRRARSDGAIRAAAAGRLARGGGGSAASVSGSGPAGRTAVGQPSTTGPGSAGAGGNSTQGSSGTGHAPGTETGTGTLRGSGGNSQTGSSGTPSGGSRGGPTGTPSGGSGGGTPPSSGGTTPPGSGGGTPPSSGGGTSPGSGGGTPPGSGGSTPPGGGCIPGAVPPCP